MTRRKPLNRGKQKENSSPPRARSRPEKARKSAHGGGQQADEPTSRVARSPVVRARPADARARNDKADDEKKPARNSKRQPGKNPSAHINWLYGIHAVHEALKNPQRTFHKLMATTKSANALPDGAASRITPQLATADEIADMLPDGAVHQGLALHVAPLPDLDLEDILDQTDAGLDELDAARPRPILFLDQVSDPHNIGAILRSASAFGAAAVIVQDRHAPQVTGVMAKSASGALEHIPLVRVTNLARALERVAQAGYFRLGLTGEAEAVLGKCDVPEKTALVLGAEGPGLRRLTREKCDLLIKLPTQDPISSLNVSNAAAVALFALTT